MLVPGVLGAVAFLAAVVCAVALGSTLGIAVGFVVRNALARSETLARYRTPAAAALFLGYMYVVATADFESAFEPVNVTRGREAVIPSLLGFGVYSIALVLAASPGAVVQLAAARDALAGATKLSTSKALTNDPITPRRSPSPRRRRSRPA